MFFKISISHYKKKNKKSFLVAFFKSSDHFMVFLFVLITLEPILDGYLRIWANPEIQDGSSRDWRFQWQSYFEKICFYNLDFSYFQMKQ